MKRHIKKPRQRVPSSPPWSERVCARKGGGGLFEFVSRMCGCFGVSVERESDLIEKFKK